MANIGGRLEIERTHAIVSNTVISWLEKKNAIPLSSWKCRFP